MRIVVGGSGLIVICCLIIVIHTAIINKNVRQNQVDRSLSQATDYGIAMMRDIYSTEDFSPDKYSDEYEDELIDKLMRRLCENINCIVGAKGDIEVRLLDCDLKKGEMDIVVLEYFDYQFGTKRGLSVCERAVKFEI